MPSKKERIEFLEAECETHREALKELNERVRELEAKLVNAWLIPTANPVNVRPGWLSDNMGYCPTCGQYYWGGGHVCYNPIKVTWTNRTTAEHS